jgi:hypothetical protein
MQREADMSDWSFDTGEESMPPPPPRKRGWRRPVFAAAAILCVLFLLDIIFGVRFVGRRDTLFINAGVVLISAAILALFIRHTKGGRPRAR